MKKILIISGIFLSLANVLASFGYAKASIQSQNITISATVEYSITGSLLNGKPLVLTNSDKGYGMTNNGGTYEITAKF
jgi:hypothetical protein